MGMTVQKLIEALTEVGDKSASVVFEDSGRIFKTSSRFEICEDFAGVVIIYERNNQMTECYGTQDRRNIRVQR